MKILIDGDSCKRKETILEIAQKRNIPVHIYCDVNHYTEEEYADVHVVDQSANSADLAIANHTDKNDIVITNDVGLASMVLAKKGLPLNNYGVIFTKNNIDSYMAHRHLVKTKHQTPKHMSIHKNHRHFFEKPEHRPSFKQSLNYLIRKTQHK